MNMSVKSLRIKRPKGKINKEKAFVILLVLVWVRTILVSYAYQTLLRIPYISFFADAIKALVYVVSVAFAEPYVKKYIKIPDYLFYVAFVIIYVLSMLLNSRTAPYLQDNWVDIILISVPTFYVGLCFDKKYIDVLHRWSRICMFFIIIYFLVIGYHGEVKRGTDQNMGLAYRILPHLIMLTLYALKQKKTIDVILSIVGNILLFACGTRGAVLSVVVFFILYIILCTNRKRRWLIALTVLFAGAFIVVFFEYIIEIFASILGSLGFSTRILRIISADSFLWDNGRNDILGFMLELVKKRPWTGYGVAGDRNIAGLFGYRANIAYSHNIFLELIVSFGYVFGIAISAYIVRNIVKAFIHCDQEEEEILLVLICSGGFLKLMFSSSFLLEFLFFVLMGYSVQIIRRKSIKRNHSKLRKP